MCRSMSVRFFVHWSFINRSLVSVRSLVFVSLVILFFYLSFIIMLFVPLSFSVSPVLRSLVFP